MDKEELLYPRSVFFIWVHQIFERFSFWGIVVVLPLFLRNVLLFTDDSATAIYHGFTIFGYLSSFVGAIVADSYFGKFKTIIGFSFVYFIGTFLLTGAATPLLNSSLQLTAALFGLILTALASGSIKPCIISFGGDQYKLPGQQKELDNYFPILYLIINFSLTLTAITTPMMRKDVSCFGDDTCYSFAFFVPFVFVILAFGILILGNKTYKHSHVEVNVVAKSINCIKSALVERIKLNQKRDHWLDYADSKFSETFIADVKQVIGLFILFLPITIFWALFDQQFSRWTFQATRMNDRVFGYAIKPDQFATLNFVLTFAFIPIFEKLIFPTLAKCHLLKKPLQKVITGALFASLSFIICACIELKIESTLTSLPGALESQLNIMNGDAFPVEIKLQYGNLNKNVSQLIAPSENHIFRNVPSGKFKVYVERDCKLAFDEYSNSCLSYKGDFLEAELLSEKSHSILVCANSQSLNLQMLVNPDDLKKSLEGNSKIKILLNDGNSSFGDFQLNFQSNINTSDYLITLNREGNLMVETDVYEFVPKKYFVLLVNKANNMSTIENLGSVELFVGGNYILTIISNGTTTNGNNFQYSMNKFTVVEPNTVSIVWLLPQYMIMSVAEVMIEISLTSFAYSQAPKHMKSLLQVVNLIPPALGGLLVVFVAESKFFERQSLEFFLFSAVNFIAVVILIFLAKRYKPVVPVPMEE